MKNLFFYAAFIILSLCTFLLVLATKVPFIYIAIIALVTILGAIGIYIYLKLPPRIPKSDDPVRDDFFNKYILNLDGDERLNKLVEIAKDKNSTEREKRLAAEWFCEIEPRKTATDRFFNKYLKVYKGDELIQKLKEVGMNVNATQKEKELAEEWLDRIEYYRTGRGE